MQGKKRDYKEDEDYGVYTTEEGRDLSYTTNKVGFSREIRRGEG